MRLEIFQYGVARKSVTTKSVSPDCKTHGLTSHANKEHFLINNFFVFSLLSYGMYEALHLLSLYINNSSRSSSLRERKAERDGLDNLSLYPTLLNNKSKSTSPAKK
jgi:hypothetical protein